MVLSPAVLRRIASRVDQATRVACCVASKHACNALRHPSVWQQASVYKLTDHATAFLKQMDTRVVTIEIPKLVEAHSLEWFLAGLHPQIHTLRLCVEDLSLTSPHSIMSCICDLSELQQLVIECAIVRQPTCIAFPPDASLRELKTVRITEFSEERMLEVYFDDARLPALKDVFLEVNTSDVLVNPKLYPSLLSVCYFASHETYEDAHLEGVRLDGLSVNVMNKVAMGYLLCTASRAGQLGTVTLRCFSDVHIDAYLPTRALYLHTMPSVSTVEFLFPVVRGFDILSVHPHLIGARTSWTVRFLRAGSWHNFQSWLHRTKLHVGFEGSVAVDPV